MEKIKDYDEWLNQSPTSFNAGLGLLYIKPHEVMKMLDELGQWDTTYFKCDFQEVGKKLLLIASCTLVVRYDSKIITRKGSVSLPVEEGDLDMDISSTLLDLCVCDAAKKLGVRFGRELDDDFWRDTFKVRRIKPRPSEIVVGQWKAALKDGNEARVVGLEASYDFSSIENFGLLKASLKKKK